MAEQSFRKEVDGYDRVANDHRNDFVGERELTVTITLEECRQLVTTRANHQHEETKLREELIGSRDENRKLRSRIDALVETIDGGGDDDDGR